MIATLTNVSGGDINVAQVGEDGVAVGGGHLGVGYADHRTNPIPFPFNAQGTGTLANSGTIVIGIRPEDWYRQHPASALSPATKLRAMVQGGIITLAYAAEANLQDPHEDWIGDVV